MELRSRLQHAKAGPLGAGNAGSSESGFKRVLPLPPPLFTLPFAGTIAILISHVWREGTR